MGDKQIFPPIVRDKHHQKSGDEKTDEDFLPHHGNVHDEGISDIRPAFRLSDFVFEGFIFHFMFTVRVTAGLSFVAGVRPRLLDQSFRQSQFHQQPHHGDQDKRADDFRQHKRPAQQKPEDETEFEDKIRRGEHECQRRHERRAFFEKSFRRGRRRVGTRRTCRAQKCRQRDLAQSSAAKLLCDLLLAEEHLHKR